MDATEKHKKSWYALYVNVRHEKKIIRKMAEAGIESYAPVMKTMKQWSDRKKLVEVPLIAGYVFVRLSAAELDRPRYIPGVVNYVRFNGKPAVIRTAEIDGLKYFVENGYSLEEMSPAEFKVGEQVRFMLSEFKDFTATIENIEGGKYAVITFEGVSKNYKLKAPVKALKPIAG